MARTSGSHAICSLPINRPSNGIKREREDSTPPNPQPDRKKPKLSRKECLICTDEVVKNQYPKKPHAGHEQHTSDVCFKCYNQHIEAEIDQKGPDLVSCPQCSQTLSEPEVRKLTRVATYKK